MRLILSCLLALGIAGCGSSDGAAGDADDDPYAPPSGDPPTSDPDFKSDWSHTFPSVFVESGTERDYDCQAWTLNNDEPIYVSAVRQQNEGAWHHSNWFYVPEDMFGEDGTFDCRDESFGMVEAAIWGGVVFAQSTQTFEETFRFPERSAVVIPPRSKIIGALHLVNIAAGDIETSITLEFEDAEPDSIDVSLQPLSFLIYSLQIPPQQQSRWRMTCDMTGVYSNLIRNHGTADDFGIYYVLGHYHSWGNYFALDYVDDDGTERNIVELENTIGDSLGAIVDPPIFANEAPGLKVTCGYNNTTDKALVWGNNAEDEMCMFLAYVGAPVKVVSWGSEPSEEVGMVDGFRTFEAGCGDVTAIPAR